MTIKYNNTLVELENGLTIVVKDWDEQIYDQFLMSKLFGVNFGWGQWFNPTDYLNLEVFILDHQIFSSRALGYLGDCIKTKDGYNVESSVSIMGGVFGKEYFKIALFLLDILNKQLSSTDLIIVNNIDQSLLPVEKLIWFRVIGNLSKIKPVFMATKDIASLRLSQIEFQILDGCEELDEFFGLVDAIQTNKFDEFVTNKIKAEKNARRKKRTNTKKI